MKSFVVISFVAVVLLACNKDESQMPVPASVIRFEVPKGWPAPKYSFQNNTLTQAGFDLGRKLFYETQLSRDNTISCGSCHQQFAAFSHLDHKLSHGINGKFGTRNAPGIYNVNWIPELMWDGGVNHIEVQPLAPITNPVEMDESIDHVITKLTADDKYKSMFKAAFGDEEINSQRMFKALAQFMGSMVSSNSKYDKYVRGESGGTLTASEKTGLDLFRKNCAACHQEPLFSDYTYRSNGLAMDNKLKDAGRAHITQNPADSLHFRVPSLRNVALSMPYMHDGRFATLEACIDHYTQNTSGYNAYTDPLLKNGIMLSSNEKADIIRFLYTLSDTQFIKDERFSEPK